MKPVLAPIADDAMEFGGNANPVVTSMQIDNTRKMFELLINNIYSEKEKTVVRELMANAFDAHVSANKSDIPIDVWLPTPIAPNFVVRDYGIGMSDEFVKKLYSRVGYSTKTESNDETGTFGVGSKSPLSISDTFMLKCFDDTGVRTYTIVVPPDSGIPQIIDGFHSYSTGEREYGVEVTVPVGKASISGFVEGLREQHFAWFDKPVNFKGVGATEYEQYESITKLVDGMYLGNLKEEHAHNYQDSYVRQGAAVYPLNLHKLGAPAWFLLDFAKCEVIKQLGTAKRKVLFDIPIGTANVTAAREHLSYDDGSCDNLAKHISLVMDKFMETLEQVVFPFTTAYEAFDKLVAYFLPEGERENIVELTYLSKALMPWIGNLARERFDGHGDIQLGANLKCDSIEGVALSMFPCHVSNYINIAQRCDGLDIKIPSITYIFPRGTPEWRQKIDRHSRTVIPNAQRTGTRVPVNVIQCGKTNIARVKAWFTERNLDRYIFTHDDIGEPAPPKPLTKRYSVKDVIKWENAGWGSNKVTADFTEPAYYVVANGKQGANWKYWINDSSLLLENPNAVESWRDYNAFSALLKSELFDDTLPVYRLTVSQLKSVTKKGAWIDLVTHVRDKVELVLEANPHIVQNYRGMNFWQVGLYELFEASFICADEYAIKVVNELSRADTSFAAVAAWSQHNVAHLNKYDNRTRRNDLLHALCRVLGIKFESFVPDGVLEKMNAKYTALASIAPHIYKDKWKHVYYYVAGMSLHEPSVPFFDVNLIPGLRETTREFMVARGLISGIPLNELTEAA